MDKYPGLYFIAEGWKLSPWTRVSFGVQWVVEPEGQYPLTFSIKNPARYFGSTLEESLKRFIRIRSHERGSSGEAEAILAVREEIEQDRAVRLGNDPYERTKEIFNAGKGDLTKRFPGVFLYPDPEVRARAAELLGEYAEREPDTGFRPGGTWDDFGAAVAVCLDDEDEAVRAAAAVAIFKFLDQPVQAGGTEQRVAAAKVAWTAGLADAQVQAAN